LRRDPNDPARWCSAGDAMLRAGRDADAQYCYSQALALGPHIPPVLMQAADFYYDRRQTGRALQQMSRVLADTDVDDDYVFAWYGRKKLPVSEVLSHGLPPGPRAATAYMRGLMTTGGVGTKEVWNWIAARGLSDLPLARDYVRYLFKDSEYAAAAGAWAQYLAPRSDGYLESNWVYNGEFESELSDTPFDWRINARDGVEAAVDAHVAHSGSHSIRIQFAGKENLDYNDVGQTAFVKPGRYQFEAYIHTEGITTDKGIGLHIYDRESGARLDVRTEELTGTHGWTNVERVLTVPKTTRLLAIEVSRQRSMKFDSLIAGTVWIDSVTLTPIQ
jgi:hypothetical protein